MTTAIQIEKTETGYNVKFPYELKDSFRDLFPSAKWDSYEKCWKCGPRSGKRLEQWKAEAETTAEKVNAANAAKSEADLLQAEVEVLQSKLGQVLIDIQNIEKSRLIVTESRQQLEQFKAELEAASQRKEDVETALLREREEVREMVSKIIDLPACHRAQEIMQQNFWAADRAKKAKFNEAQEIVIQARRQLEESGFTLSAISWLASANINRRDRDLPSLMRSDAWYRIRKIEE